MSEPAFPDHQVVRANVLLCDSAQVMGGKLYILGGGWSYFWLAAEGMPIGFVLGIDLILPWEFANRHMKLAVALLDEDGEPVTNDADQPIRIEGEVVAGRAPTARAGTDIHIPLTLPFGPLTLGPGGYVCALTIDGEPVNKATFQVALAQR
jgi:hypothetical protein